MKNRYYKKRKSSRKNIKKSRKNIKRVSIKKMKHGHKKQFKRNFVDIQI